jgi:APA family basic amino acid/polyamine antiporter
MADLFAKKTLEQLKAEADASDDHGTLKRALGPVSLVALGIGAVIGAGIFVLTGSTAANYAGPAVVLSFVLAGLGCAFAGLCYAEFASLIPIAGSAYTYGYATLGELVAWIIGWDLILEYGFGAATVASGWSANVSLFLQKLGFPLPPSLIDTPGTKLVLYHNVWQPLVSLPASIDPSTLPQATAVFNAIAFIAIAVVTTILIIGIRESAMFNSIIVIVKLATVLIFIAVAAAYVFGHMEIAKANWTPFIPPDGGSFGQFGWGGILRGAGVVFFAYIGFDAVSTAAQEAKNPKRDMPIGILGSLFICTLLYILTSGLLTGVKNYKELNTAAPVALGMQAIGVEWGEWVVLIGSIFGLSTVMLVMLLGQSRVLYSMSRDGLLWKWVGAVHPRFQTPWISSVAVGIFVSIFASVVPIGELGELVSIGTLLAFVIVCAGVWVLRVKNPDVPRAFKTPMVPLVPILGMVISLALMAGLPAMTWIRLVVWLIIGLVIYFSYGRKNSGVQRRLLSNGRGQAGRGIVNAATD